VRSYLGESDPKNPLASPVYGDLAGLPPVRVHVGDNEVLLDDSRRYAERAVAAGVDAKLDVLDGNATRVRQQRWEPERRQPGPARYRRISE
jgi:acetyl esterase/lipase